MNPDQSTPNKKPIVVLAGWLGCQPRNLRRYSQMYDHIGWDSLIRIGSPRSVVAAMTEGPSYGQSSKSEMKHLAINILQELQTKQPPHFVLHIFSNNGCFLWEWMRFLLYENDAPLPSAAGYNIDIHNLRGKLIGIIFDSAPAHYNGNTDTLQSALHYVSSVTERNHLMNVTKSLDAQVTKQRFDNFWNSLCNGMIDTPQMHLYSQSDKLASAKQLEKLIAYREKNAREGKIWKHMFEDSEHCCHLMKYPEEYDRSVKQFLRFCTGHIDVMGDNLENTFSRRSRL